jgi:effector-binding domain-containing protein
MLRKIAVTLAVFVMLLAAVLFYIFSQGPELGKYEFLKQPRITTLPAQRMLVVTAQGDPNAVASKAFGLLFKTYFKISGVPKSLHLAPRARWAGDMRVKSSWTGYYAMPVPDQTASLPDITPEPGCKVELTTWEYGDVAEILHIGPYAEETPAIEKLRQFLKQKGYAIIGYHEEEYLKGPGLFSQGDPGKYYTIIRYRVRKKT